MRKKKQLSEAQAEAQLDKYVAKLDAEYEKKRGFDGPMGLGGMLTEIGRRRVERQTQLRALLSTPEAIAKRREILATKSMRAVKPPPSVDEKQSSVN
jgi:hypothetical protein